MLNQPNLRLRNCLEWVLGHQKIEANERAHALGRHSSEPSVTINWPETYDPRNEREERRKQRMAYLKVRAKQIPHSSKQRIKHTIHAHKTSTNKFTSLRHDITLHTQSSKKTQMPSKRTTSSLQTTGTRTGNARDHKTRDIYSNRPPTSSHMGELGRTTLGLADLLIKAILKLRRARPPLSADVSSSHAMQNAHSYHSNDGCYFIVAKSATKQPEL